MAEQLFADTITKSRPKVLDWTLSAFEAIRLHQWVKNVLVFTPVPFIIKDNPGSILMLLGLFAGFCMAASSGYLANDILDRNRDREHPTKRYRAIASGRLPVFVALKLAGALAFLSLLTGNLLGKQAFLMLTAYLLLTLLYSLFLKHVPILDIVLVGFLFALRTFAGFSVVGLADHGIYWVILVGVLTTAVAAGKRRSELQKLGRGSRTRRTLSAYTYTRINVFLAICAGLMAILYPVAAWTLSPLFVPSIALVSAATAQFWRKVTQLTEDIHPQYIIMRDPVIRSIILVYTCYFTAIAVTV